jgi:hypothetical protein
VSSKRQYKRRIKSWGFGKNIKWQEKEAIVRKKIQRKTVDGKESAFRLRGLPVEEAKIDRYMKEKPHVRVNVPSPAPGMTF